MPRKNPIFSHPSPWLFPPLQYSTGPLRGSSTHLSTFPSLQWALCTAPIFSHPAQRRLATLQYFSTRSAIFNAAPPRFLQLHYFLTPIRGTSHRSSTTRFHSSVFREAPIISHPAPWRFLPIQYSFTRSNIFQRYSTAVSAGTVFFCPTTLWGTSSCCNAHKLRSSVL